MRRIKLVLPKNLVLVGPDDIVFFLGGPIRGAGDWQKNAILGLEALVSEHAPEGQEVYVVCPSRYTPEHELFHLSVAGKPSETYSEAEKIIMQSQTNWERYYLEIASRQGSIVFWLAAEDAENPRKKEDGPYARDTYGELGEWRARLHYEKKFGNRHLHFIMGADPAFHGLDQIEKNYKAMVNPDFMIFPTLEKTIQAAFVKATYIMKY